MGYFDGNKNNVIRNVEWELTGGVNHMGTFKGAY